MRSILGCLALISLSLHSQGATALDLSTVAAEGVDIVAIPSPFISGEYQLAESGGTFYSWQGDAFGFIGQPALLPAGADRTVTLSRTDLKKFTFVGIRIGPAAPLFKSAQSIVFTGIRTDHSSFTRTLTIAGNFLWTTFDVGPEFANVLRVSWVQPTDGAIQFADVRVDAQPSESSTPVSRPGIFRSGFYWLHDTDGNHQWNAPPDYAFAFGGIAGDIPITGDWNGSGTTKVGVYRPSNGLFVLDYDGDHQFTAADKAYYLGVGIDPTDVPVVGDWNGDGRAKVGLFRQGFLWILDTDGNGVFNAATDGTFAFGGVAGDKPVVGDWDGSGRSKIGLFRQGFYWILDSNGNGSIDNVNLGGGDQAFPYGGIAGDVPVVGDWNGDGRTKVGVFRAGFFWVLDGNGNYQFDGTGGGQDFAFPFGGIPGDKPVVGKW
jgi:hypothetical protein